MTSYQFGLYRHSGRVEGLISIAGRSVVDRSTIKILSLNGWKCKKFELWVKIGGRLGAVSVPAELKRLRSLEAEALKVANP